MKHNALDTDELIDSKRSTHTILTKPVSAKGAEYDSQGQAPNNVRRFAPGNRA
jgi:hypothetical protein